MCVGAHVATRQLHSVASTRHSQGFCPRKQRRTDALAATIGPHVDTLQLRAPAARVLEVLKDEHLTDADDLVVVVCDEHVTLVPTGLEYRAPVGVVVVGILGVGRQRTVADEPRRSTYIVAFNGTNSK